MVILWILKCWSQNSLKNSKILDFLALATLLKVEFTYYTIFVRKIIFRRIYS